MNAIARITASRIQASRLYTFRFTVGNGVATFEVEANNDKQAWQRIVKQQLSILQYTTKIELVGK